MKTIFTENDEYLNKKYKNIKYSGFNQTIKR